MTCSTAVARLKMGPVDIDRVINEGEAGRKYTDPLFHGKQMIYHEQFLDDEETEDFYDSNFESGNFWFERWPEVYRQSDLFTHRTSWEDVS